MEDGKPEVMWNTGCAEWSAFLAPVIFGFVLAIADGDWKLALLGPGYWLGFFLLMFGAQFVMAFLAYAMSLPFFLFDVARGRGEETNNLWWNFFGSKEEEEAIQRGLPERDIKKSP